MINEIKTHHRYITLLTAPIGEVGDKNRILSGIQLLTIQTMLMFLLAVFYDLLILVMMVVVIVYILIMIVFKGKVF